MQENLSSIAQVYESKPKETKSFKVSTKLMLGLICLIIFFVVVGFVGVIILRSKQESNNLNPSLSLTVSPTTVPSNTISITLTPTETQKQTYKFNTYGQSGSLISKGEISINVPISSIVKEVPNNNDIRIESQSFLLSFGSDIEINYQGYLNTPEMLSLSNTQLGLELVYRIKSASNRFFYTNSFINDSVKCQQMQASPSEQGQSFDEVKSCSHTMLDGNGFRFFLACTEKSSGGVDQCDQMFSSLEYKKL